jgi:hypothetical protein
MTTRRVVLDANIPIRAVLGVWVREHLVRYGDDVVFFTVALTLARRINGRGSGLVRVRGPARTSALTAGSSSISRGRPFSTRSSSSSST